jgi:cytochrome P450
MTAGPTATDKKASRPGDRNDPAYEWEQRGRQRVLVLRSFGLAHTFLKIPSGTEQAGFGSDFSPKTRWMNAPTLFSEGPGHREQRRAAARFFTPKAVAQTHEPLMVALADALVGAMEREGGGDVAVLSFRMAMAVVAEIVGLTASDPRGLEARLEGFFETAPSVDASLATTVRETTKAQGRTLRFYARDGRPAIRARREAPADDVISHMLAKGMRTQDILIEALTYAAAGMVTTRQFIPMAMWHLVDRPELLERYLTSEADERRRMLAEIIRLDTVAGNLLRRVTEPTRLEHDGVVVHLPVGTLVDVAVRSTNTDESAVGECPFAVDPDRELAPKVPASGLAFGAGHHSCPGEYLALHETDIVLMRLFRNTVTIERAPDITWNDLVMAYDLADFRIRLTPKH